MMLVWQVVLCVSIGNFVFTTHFTLLVLGRVLDAVITGLFTSLIAGLSAVLAEAS